MENIIKVTMKIVNIMGRRTFHSKTNLDKAKTNQQKIRTDIIKIMEHKMLTSQIKKIQQMDLMKMLGQNQFPNVPKINHKILRKNLRIRSSRKNSKILRDMGNREMGIKM